MGIRIQDVKITHPEDHRKYGLPIGVGVILLRLPSPTTSQQNKQADMVISFETASGLKLVYWMGQLLGVLIELKWYSPTYLLFQDIFHKLWTSRHF